MRKYITLKKIFISLTNLMISEIYHIKKHVIVLNIYKIVIFMIMKSED
jgi:hypothetical protein